MDASSRLGRPGLRCSAVRSVCAWLVAAGVGCSARGSDPAAPWLPSPRFDATVGGDGKADAAAATGEDDSHPDAQDVQGEEPQGSTDAARGGGGGDDPGAGDGVAGKDATGPVDATDSADSESADGDMEPTAWQPAPDCAPQTQQIYLLTKDYQLHAYLPQTKQLTYIGTLECPAEYATWPFSMGVDRKGVAWVMYSSGELFQVSTTTAQCQPTAWVPGTSGFIESGMGFVASGPASQDELLYIANGKSKLGAIDTATLAVQVQGTIGIYPGWPELTGTGKGELWGFFPQSQPAQIARIDKASGAVSQVKALDQLDMAAVKNWAFAHWGGRFLMFFQAEKAPSTSVYIYDPGDGSYGLYHPQIGLPVVGAGVSSCAPTTWLTLP
jgi:hypothetical protein